MKALSIWQPWASLIAEGHKRFETRSWSTEYRGPIVICSGKISNLTMAMFEHFYHVCPMGFQSLDGWINKYIRLPRGCALCVAYLVGVYRTENIAATPNLLGKEIALGNFNHGRFAWDLQNIRRFLKPWPVRGRQGLFEIPDEEVAKHELERS